MNNQQNWPHWCRAVVLCAVGVLGAVAVHAGEGANLDSAGWYGTVAGGVKLNQGSSTTQVEEGVLGVPVLLSGRTQWGHGPTFSASLGRQFRMEGADRSEDARLWRLEGEYWGGRLERKSFKVAALNARLGDRLRADALFLNGLVRVASTEHSRWWLGAGIGYADVRLPDASGGPLNCACLGAAGGSGTAYRFKAQAERLLSDQSAVFLELGYVKLPSVASTATGFPKTRYDGLGVTHLSVGWRQRF